MKKISKQKKNQPKGQARQLHQPPSENSTHDPAIATQGEVQQLPTTNGIDDASPNLPIPVEPAEVEAESGAAVNPNVPLNLAAALKQKAALLTQNQQRSQWNQQRKAGKMVNAHVPKRFNRGG